MIITNWIAGSVLQMCAQIIDCAETAKQVGNDKWAFQLFLSGHLRVQAIGNRNASYSAMGIPAAPGRPRRMAKEPVSEPGEYAQILSQTLHCVEQNFRNLVTKLC